MKTRKAFFKTSLDGLFVTLFGLGQIENGDFASGGKTTVVQRDEGDTYFVRENTPLTIKMSKKTTGANSISFCSEEIPPGGTIPVHKHLYADEFFVFEEGTAILITEDNDLTVNPGCCAFVPKATWHGLKNIGNGTLRFSFGYSPAGFEDFFREIGTAKGLPFEAKSKDQIIKIARKYGMVYK